MAQITEPVNTAVQTGQSDDVRVDASLFPKPLLLELADYIKADTLDEVNKTESAFPVRKTFYTRFGKRFIDIILSLLAIIITLPINLIIGIITIFDVGFPIFFKQTRIGMDRKEFFIYKFRNMTNEVDANGDPLPPSQRVTKWGKFVRKTSLDELLNFVSVLKGDMSIIGPRPLIRTYVGRLHDRHLMMYTVRPGLECPILKKLDHSPTWQDRLDNYAWYAQNVSFATDLKMVWSMVAMVFARESTAKRSVSKNGAVLGYDSSGIVIDSNAVPKKYIDMLMDNHGFTSMDDIEDFRSGKNSN